MKLPKSFLAVNLSESHTFHKKEELHDGQQWEGTSSLDTPEDRDAASRIGEMTNRSFDTGTSNANGEVDR